jgi:alkylation response protein AidB-like acyl-CoA dehydrogenase
MRYLESERLALNEAMPGFDDQLKAFGLQRLEADDSPGLEAFRAHGGCGLLVAPDYGGAGVGARTMIRLQRAMGSRSPSLVLSTNMHSCTVAAIPLAESTADLLGDIACNHRLVASGFADGRSRSSILAPSMSAEKVEGGWILNGQKKPCSLSRSMDYFTASAILKTDDNGPGELALATLTADAEGLSVTPFGHGLCFGGAENGVVELKNVFVPDEAMSRFGDATETNEAITFAFIWFQLLVTAAYLGVASGLVERVLEADRGDDLQRMMLVTDTEAAMRSLDRVAEMVDTMGQGGNSPETIVVAALQVRYFVQDTIDHTCAAAVELLGGLAYLADPASIIYSTSSRGLAFHPPSRASMAPNLERYRRGGELVMP